ncbi:HAD-IIIA family hydrolase [Psychromonas sp. Urea-02u-13]|uniref:HAD-IIIA family hydrolase n=1 Tax=Psychromonas sp. Urea-02u-13 TaxID=2058326 RepID=UPI000C31E725|nr:HAD-IIIA family hydrolase [Psychromonas sp. Urea-02u-13]PKG38907.1 haloacid dehalogenase [Psychromonas sp. Urea-02u-13]
MKYKVIIFDWDGTLMDSIDKIVACVKAAAEDCQLMPPSTPAIRHIIGLSLDIAMAELFPETTVDQQIEVANAYRHQYVSSDQYETPFYPGIRSWLNDLKEQGYMLAVATGKGHHGLNRLLEKFQLTSFFAVTYCADQTASKPDPLMLNRILDDLGLDASQALMIGDTSYDLEMANNANMDCLGVSYGVHSKNVLKQFNPLAIVDDLPKEFALHVQ